MIESINLNLIPSGVSPVCHVSQYDEGRQIKINLFEGINPYTIQSGDAFTLNVRKPDNTIVTTSVSGTQGNTYITISTTEQIAAVVGENLCELKITNGSIVIGTLNFIMQVERDVLADGIPSQSVIEDLDERIAEAIGDNYYNKTETDALLALKADKTELYNVYPTDQESGAIAHFTDGADNIPVKSLVSEIVAVESGNGQPKSPTNPYTISGFDNGVVTRLGKNLMPQSTISGTLSYPYNLPIPLKPNANGYVFSAVATSSDTDANTCIILFEFADGTNAYAQFPRNTRNSVAIPNTDTKSLKTIRFYASDIYEHSTGDTFSFNDIQIEVGDTATTYEAYNGNTYTFTFGQTVFGGHFDNKGNLVVTHELLTLDGTENYVLIGTGANRRFRSSTEYTQYSNMRISSHFIESPNYSQPWGYYRFSVNYLAFMDNNTQMADVTALQTWLANQYSGGTPVQFLCELANPITLAITIQDIPTLLGENNIFSNTGDVDVTIRADIGLYIDKRLNVSRSTPNNLVRAAAYVEDPESVNETQEDNEEPQNDER